MEREERERQREVISRYIPAVRAAGTTTNVSRYSRGIELQLARLSLGRFCRGVTRNMLGPPSTIWSRRWDSIVNPAVSARPAGWLVGLAGWLAGGWFGWLSCETMPVTATGLYPTLFLSPSNLLFPSLSFLFPLAVEIFISGDRDSPIARALPLFSQQPRYLRDGSRAFMFLSGTVPPCSFLPRSPHTSSSYFSILFSPFLVLTTAMSVQRTALAWEQYITG